MKTPEEIFKDYFPHVADKIHFVDESQKQRYIAKYMMDDLNEDLMSQFEFKTIEVPSTVAFEIFKKGYLAACKEMELEIHENACRISF